MGLSARHATNGIPMKTKRRPARWPGGVRRGRSRAGYMPRFMRVSTIATSVEHCENRVPLPSSRCAFG